MSYLESQKLEYIVVQANDLDDFISEIYDVDFSIQASEEADDDICLEFTVQDKPLNEYRIQRLDQFRIGNQFNWMTDILLQDLCNKGLIEPGEYLIRI